jgi:hypothetical protein
MENHRDLLEDFRALAADGPQQAPNRVELRLRADFRRLNHRRRARIWASYASAAALAAGIALFTWIREVPKPAAVATVAVAPAAVEEDADASFYPLPAADALPAVESAMVVRVQLPLSSLRLMGYPVEEDRADTPVQADLLLGQDGLARGVRLAE